MTESGGPTTHSGISYQDGIAALHLGRLLDPRPYPDDERVIEVRVEAPEAIDDVVVTHPSGKKTLIQAKEALTFSGELWFKLWRNVAAQIALDTTRRDNIVLVLGTSTQDAWELAETCDRAKDKKDQDEWWQALRTERLRSIAERIKSATSECDLKSAFALCSRLSVFIWTRRNVQRDMIATWIPPSNQPPETLYALLSEMVTSRARTRHVFHQIPVTKELRETHRCVIAEAAEWNGERFRAALRADLGSVSVPAGSTSPLPIEEVFLWVPAIKLKEKTLHRDFEDELIVWSARTEERVDLRDFPSSKLRRAVIDAGAGFGKTTLLKAIACRLIDCHDRMPTFIPLDALAQAQTEVIDFLLSYINPKHDSKLDWRRLCEWGVTTPLFDGLDELSDADRQFVLGAIKRFAGTYPDVPFLLTVRDPAAISSFIEVDSLQLSSLDDPELFAAFVNNYGKFGSKLSLENIQSHLDRNPDLAALLKTPLFLALVLTTFRPGERLPKNRAQVLDQYITVLLKPARYKEIAKPVTSPPRLLEAAKALAFFGLEKGKLGLSEWEAETILAESLGVDDAEPYLEILTKYGVFRRSDSRLRFYYPTLQEYLAALHMDKFSSAEIEERFSLISQRPWAQAVQFALERHKYAESIIRSQLTAVDDVFFTKLRLIARCIINGAAVSTELRTEIGYRLVEAWPIAGIQTRYSVARLIADGFSSHARNTLSQAFISLRDGFGVVLAAIDDQTATLSFLNESLRSPFEQRFRLWSLAPAIHKHPVPAFDAMVDRCREAMCPSDVEIVAEILAKMPKQVPHEKLYLVWSDEQLPAYIRFAAMVLGQRPIPAPALTLVERILETGNLHSGIVHEHFFQIEGSERQIANWCTTEDGWSISAAFCELLTYKVRPPEGIRQYYESMANNTKINIDIRLRVFSELIHSGSTSLSGTFAELLASKEPDIIRFTFEHAIALPESDVISLLEMLNYINDQSVVADLVNTLARGVTQKLQPWADFGRRDIERYEHPAIGRICEWVRKELLVTAEDVIFRGNTLMALITMGDEFAIQPAIDYLSEAAYSEYLPTSEWWGCIGSIFFTFREHQHLIPRELLSALVHKWDEYPVGEIAVAAAGSGEAGIRRLIEYYNNSNNSSIQISVLRRLEHLAPREGYEIIRSNGRLRLKQDA